MSDKVSNKCQLHVQSRIYDSDKVKLQRWLNREHTGVLEAPPIGGASREHALAHNALWRDYCGYLEGRLQKDGLFSPKFLVMGGKRFKLVEVET